MPLASVPTTTPPVPDPPPTGARSAGFAIWSARLGTVKALAAFAMLGVMEVIAVRQGYDPVTATLSQHALRDQGWVFTAAMVVLAAGSAAIVLSLVASGIARMRSSAAAASALWCLGLVLVASFTKHDWSAGASPSGYAHWTGTVMAFLSLPCFAVLLARPWFGDPRWRKHAGLTALLGIVAVLCLLPIGAAMATHVLTGTPWWEIVHLGVVERLLAFAEFVVVVAAAWWALSASSGLRALRMG